MNSLDTLIHSIQDDLVNPSAKLSTTLRKALVLASRLNNNPFTAWVRQELDGYPDIENMPDYRILQTQSFGNFISIAYQAKNMPIPGTVLPEELQDYASKLHIRNGIRSMESMVEEGESHSRILWATEWLGFASRAYDGSSCVQAWRLLSRTQVEQIIDTIKNRLLTFLLELEQIDTDFGNGVSTDSKQTPNEHITNMFSTIIMSGNITLAGEVVSKEKNMTVFDQRNQKVEGNQYNAARDITFSTTETGEEFASNIRALQTAIKSLKDEGELEADLAADLNYQIEKAAVEAEKPEPDKSSIQDRLKDATEWLKGIAAASSLVTALLKAIEVAGRIF